MNEQLGSRSCRKRRRVGITFLWTYTGYRWSTLVHHAGGECRRFTSLRGNTLYPGQPGYIAWVALALHCETDR